MVRGPPSETSDSHAFPLDAWWSHAAVLRLPTARSHHDAGGGADPVSVSAAGNSCAAAEASQRTQVAGISYATLTFARTACTWRVHLYPVFAASFCARD